MPKVLSTLPQKRFDMAGVQFPPDWQVTYHTDYSEEALAQACPGMDFILVTPQPPITANVIARMDKMRLIQMVGAGYDKIDITAAARAGIPVANSPGQNASTVAEFTIGMIIALQRRIVEADTGIKAGQYGAIRDGFISSGLGEIRDSRLGLIGLGNIGREVARIARILGADVFYYTPHRKSPEMELHLGVQYLPLDDLLKTCDIISLHTPLNEQTRNIIGTRELAMLKPTALLVNTSRGGIIDEMALVEAIKRGSLAGAALDTFSVEPLPESSPLVTLPLPYRNRLLLTPHLAGVTAAAFTRMLKTAIGNMQRVARGEAPLYVVNGV